MTKVILIAYPVLGYLVIRYFLNKWFLKGVLTAQRVALIDSAYLILGVLLALLLRMGVIEVILIGYLVLGLLVRRYILMLWLSRGVLTAHRFALVSGAYPILAFLLAIFLSSKTSVEKYLIGVGFAIFLFLVSYILGRIVFRLFEPSFSYLTRKFPPRPK